LKFLALFLSLAILWVVAGCAQVGSPVASPTAVPATATPSPPPSATFTAVPPTATATPSPTCTATAVPATPTPSPSPLPTTGTWSGQQTGSLTVPVDSGNGITETVEVHYLLYLPQGYGQEPAQKWPLVVFLHGSEERGDDPNLLRREGLPKLLEGWPDFPAVVVSPQCPQGKRWWSRAHIVGAFLDQVQSMYAVDTGRIYLTGISMGAYGAWALALRYPQRFAALVPIAGGANAVGDDMPPNLCDLVGLPVWVFHGRLDQNVPYTESERAVQALRACGGNVRFTLYDDAAHREAWERAYQDQALYQWLFAQRRMGL